MPDATTSAAVPAAAPTTAQPTAQPTVATPAPTAAPTALTPDVPAPAAAAAPTEPEKFEVKYPEGFDQKYGEKVSEIAKKHSLKSAQAQAFVDLYGDIVKSEASEHQKMIAQWAEDAKADKDLGGVNWDSNLAVARKALDRLGSPELKALLASSGLGNHKDVIKLFTNIGKSISEERLPGGGGPTSNGAPTSRYEQLKAEFPNSPEMWGDPNK